MKNIIKTILKKHNFPGQNKWMPDIKTTIYKEQDESNKYVGDSGAKELALLKKWCRYIPQGWYGFAMAPCPSVWLDIIDEFLEYFEALLRDKKIYDFEIHQIKVKFGSVRFYVAWSTTDKQLDKYLRSQIDKLELALYDDKLVY